jgi:hypothetical protein
MLEKDSKKNEKKVAEKAKPIFSKRLSSSQLEEMNSKAAIPNKTAPIVETEIIQSVEEFSEHV